MGALIRSNLQVWRELHDQDYFSAHPIYQGYREFDPLDAVTALEWLGPLDPDMEAVVIGCGYGRETAALAKRIRRVWAIDVSEKILNQAMGYLARRGITNVEPVLAAQANTIPYGIDLFFSMYVMQHLTRDLVRQYFSLMGEKLSRIRPRGGAVIQFSEHRDKSLVTDAITRGRPAEPYVCWSSFQIIDLIDAVRLQLDHFRTTRPKDRILNHWAVIKRPC